MPDTEKNPKEKHEKKYVFVKPFKTDKKEYKPGEVCTFKDGVLNYLLTNKIVE